MLVGTLEVEVSGPAEVVALLQHGAVRAARVDPHVKCVGAALELIGGRPVGRKFDAVEDFSGCLLEPKIGAFGGYFGCDAADHLGVDVALAVGIVECRDRHTPGALAADAPVRAVLNGRTDAVLAPARDEIHVVERFECALAVTALVERDEPLVDRTEDNRRLGAPAVRVAVVDFLFRDQGAVLSYDLEHAEVGGRWLLRLVEHGEAN